MAKITFALGTSHGPLLSTPPEQWDQRVEADRQNPKLPFRGGIYNFDELVALRVKENLGAQAALDVRTERHASCQRAIGELAEQFSAAAVDILVIIGNDQREIFKDELTPAFSVFHGESVDNVPPSKERLAKMPPGLGASHWANSPPEGATYPCVPELGEHILRSTADAGFDAAAMKVLPE